MSLIWYLWVRYQLNNMQKKNSWSVIISLKKNQFGKLNTQIMCTHDILRRIKRVIIKIWKFTNLKKNMLHAIAFNYYNCISHNLGIILILQLKLYIFVRYFHSVQTFVRYYSDSCLWRYIYAFLLLVGIKRKRHLLYLPVM